MQEIAEIIYDAFTDTVKLLPFLFLTYAAMEYLEHKLGKKTEEIVGKAGHSGPVLGAFSGLFPQCGFSAAASDLFAGGMITMGTLLSVYLSTSDEMLPILLSEQVSVSVIVRLLGMKAAIGMTAGIFVDLIIRKRRNMSGYIRTEEAGTAHGDSRHSCKGAKCGCGEGVFRPAVRHTAHVVLFIFLFSLILNLVIGMAGENFFADLLLDKPVAGALTAGLVGLIPNCAASVALTQLYLEGLMGLGPMMAGLLVGSGVGLLVLFRVNDNVKENAAVAALLYVIGVTAGIVIDMAGIVV